MNPNNVQLVPGLTSDDLERVWLDKCPGCGQEVSAIKHDFALCTKLANAEYRIRELEQKLNELEGSLITLIRSGQG